MKTIWKVLLQSPYTDGYGVEMRQIKFQKGTVFLNVSLKENGDLFLYYMFDEIFMKGEMEWHTFMIVGLGDSIADRDKKLIFIDSFVAEDGGMRYVFEVVHE